MFRALITALFTINALPAIADCAGESYLDRLTTDQKAEVAAAVDATPYAKGLIWTLTRDAKTLTVVGTMHLFDPRLDPIRARVLPALETAELLLVETTEADEIAMQQAFIDRPELYLITEGPTLPDLLSPEDWAKVQQAAADRGLPGFIVSKFQPWYLSLTLGIPTCAMSSIAAGQRGLDQMLMNAAEEMATPVQALENWETLIAILTDGTQEEQLEMMKLGLIAPDDQQAVFSAMLDAYFAENIATVWEVSQIAARDLTGMSAENAAAQMAETQELLLTRRNLNWIPVIEDAADMHDAIVVAVGAAHLPGETGILTLLEAEGWAITPGQ